MQALENRPRIVVLEIGRPIVADVQRQLGEPFKVISYPRAVVEAEYPTILREAYAAVREAAADGAEVWLVLSGPLALAFQLGQLIGISHFKVIPYQFSAGRYSPAPPVTRQTLF